MKFAAERGSLWQGAWLRRFVLLTAIAGIALFALVGCSPAHDNEPAVPTTPAAASDCGYQPYAGGDLSQWLQGLKMINYAPSDAPNMRMWTDWQPDRLDADFARLAGLNGNAVRLFTYVTDSGFPEPSKAFLDRLDQALNLAAKHCLRVQLTLFAYMSDFQDISGSRRWAAAILTHFKNDRRIAIVELYNELDTTKPATLEWAREMASFIGSKAPRLPLTLSFSGDQVSAIRSVKAAGVPIDFVSVHYYGKPELAYTTLSLVKAESQPLPVFIGETGYSSLERSGPYGEEWWQCYQAQYLRSVQYAARLLAMPPPAPWILNDFSPGAFPDQWNSQQVVSQLGYGLLEPDGSPKPAAVAVEQGFAGTPDTQINNSFEAGQGLPDCWLVWEENQATFALDRTVAHSGSASARISASSGSPAGQPSFYIVPVQPILPERKYQAEVWVLAKANSGSVRLTLAWFDSNSRFLGSSNSRSLVGEATAWTQLSVSADAPPGAAFVQIHLVSADNAGTVWFDDVSFE